MATFYNLQRALGVVLVPDGTLLYNNRLVIGIRDVGAAVLFSENQRVVQADVQAGGSKLYNEQQVVGAVIVTDGRKLYNGARIAPVMLVGGLAPPVWIPDANRYMPAATRTHWPSGFVMTYASGLNYQCSRLFFGSPDYATNDFLIPFVGFGLTEGGNAPQETVNPSADMLIDEAYFVHPNGTKYPILFSGAAAATATAATGVVFGQVTLPTALPAWSIFGIDTYYHGTVGATYIGGYRCQRHRGERLYGAGDLASVKALADANGPSTAALDTFYNTVGNATNSQPLAYGPALVLAKGWDGRPVPLMLADSLAERQEIAASADARGNMGVWRRWLDQRDTVWGSYVPIIMGVPGSKSAQELATSATKRWALIDQIRDTYNAGKNPWTFVFDQSGRNDNSATASTWSNAKLGLVDRVKTRYGANTHVVGLTLWPTMASTSPDQARTLAGVTVSTLWDGVAGTLKTVNDTVKASSRYGAIIDAFSAYTTDADPTKAAVSEMFPLGTVLTQPGNGDGVTVWDTIKLNSGIPQGAVLWIEYQPGTYTNRTILAEAANGDGTSNYTVQEVFATIVQPNAPVFGKALNTDTNASGVTSHVHPLLHAILRTVGRVQQSEKSKMTSPFGPYLPGVPFFAGSASRRLVAGFSGPAVRLVRVTDSVEQDFSFGTTNDFLDLAAIAAWAGGSELAVKTVYDQAGSGRTLTQSALVNMPRFNPSGENGFATISADHTAAVNNNTPRGLRMAGISLERTACSIFQTERSYFSTNRLFFELTTSTVSDLRMGGSSTGVITCGAALPTSAFVKAQLETHSLVSSSSSMTARIADQVFSGLAATSAKVSTGFNQFTQVSDATKYQASDIYATVIYDTVRADAADIHSLLGLIFGEKAPRSRRIIFDGDSLMCSYGAPRGHNTPWDMDKLLVPRVDFANVATYGFRYVSSVTAVASRVGAIARAANDDLVVVRLGTNDLLADSQTGAQVLTRLQAWLAQLRTVYAGKIAVCTIPPGFWQDATKEGNRTDYNALLRSNAASMGVYVAANDTDDAFTAACIAGDASLTAGVHYTDAGYAKIAQLELAGINAALSA
jgi:lysophospholipase L1-like esterase